MPNRETTVLFADVTGSSRLYERAGDVKAADAIGACLKILHTVTRANSGRVLRNIGDEIMSVFPTADHAAQAAASMHIAVSGLPGIGAYKLSLRIAFHSGPVLQRGEDIFGDTVNLASELVAHAAKGQVLTSDQTVKKLGRFLRDSTRELPDVRIRGAGTQVSLCELVWSKLGEVTDFRLPGWDGHRQKTQIRLRLAGTEVVHRRYVESITIGRERDATFTIADDVVSRRHCTIERRSNGFVLTDHSANGTFIAFADGEAEIALHREEYVLRGHGWLSFGRPKSMAGQALEYFCEDVPDEDSSAISEEETVPASLQNESTVEEGSPCMSLQRRAYQ